MSVERGEIFVGALGPGDLDVLDAVVTPKAQTDSASLRVVVYYTDDFNREQTVEETFNFAVEEIVVEQDDEAAIAEPGDASLAGRVLKGLFGLGASAPTQIGASAIGEAVEAEPEEE
jgi:hypothetical protein